MVREGTRGVQQAEDACAGHGGHLICRLGGVHCSCGELQPGPFTHVSCGEVSTRGRGGDGFVGRSNAGITSRLREGQRNNVFLLFPLSLRSSVYTRIMSLQFMLRPHNLFGITTETPWSSYKKVSRVSTSGPLNRRRISDILQAPTS